MSKPKVLLGGGLMNKIMPHVYLVADVHVGNHRRHGGPYTSGINLRCQQILDVLGEVVTRTADHDLVIAGDLMDSSYPTPQELSATRTTLCDSDRTILVGNHEKVSDHTGDHSLGVFYDYSLLRDVIEVPELKDLYDSGAGILYVPHSATYSGIGALKTAVSNVMLKYDEAWPKHILLVCHTGIEDANTPPWMQGKGVHINDLRDLCVSTNIEAVVAGDWHEHRLWKFKDGPQIVQCGALVPTGWDNPSTLAQLNPASDPYGSLIQWTPGGDLNRYVLPGPRFVKTSNAASVPDIVAAAKKYGHELYLEVVASVDAMTQVRDAVRSIGWDGPLDVTPDKKEVDKRMKSTVLSVTNADTIGQAVTAYVESTTFESDPDKTEVTKTVMRYLQK